MKNDIPKDLPVEITDKYTVEENTFKQEVKSNPKDRIEVEIGDSKQPDFKPQAKIMRWDNEVNFSIRAEEHPNAEVKTEGKVIKYITPDYEVRQYELDPSDIGEDGGLEFEWVLPKKPSSNVLRATIQTKGLNFYYQPPLTQEEIDEGASRPENVVGSYAVYHSTKGGMNDIAGMEYKVGKAFHIYRPKVFDANGKETWGELNIDEQNGLLTVTIDQTWLDKAVYPVVVDPTFGYTSVGANTFNGTTDIWWGCSFDAPENGTVTSISWYNPTTSGDDGPFAFGLYETDSGGTDVHGYLANTDAESSPATADWNTLSISSGDGTITSGNSYLPVHWGEEYSVSYDFTADFHRYNAALGYPDTWPATLSDAPHGSGQTLSVYATYTASGGEVVPLRTLMGVGV